MSNEIKTSNRGGARSGSGRKSDFEKSNSPNQSNNKGGRPIGTTHENYKVTINVLKELEKMDKQLRKGKIDDTQLAIIKTRVDILNKLLPYVEHKKPVASLNTSDEGKIPTHTILNVVNQDNTTTEIDKDKDEGDFV